MLKKDRLKKYFSAQPDILKAEKKALKKKKRAEKEENRANDLTRRFAELQMEINSKFMGTEHYANMQKQLTELSESIELFKTQDIDKRDSTWVQLNDNIEKVKVDLAESMLKLVSGLRTVEVSNFPTDVVVKNFPEPVRTVDVNEQKWVIDQLQEIQKRINEIPTKLKNEILKVKVVEGGSSKVIVGGGQAMIPFRDSAGNSVKPLVDATGAISTALPTGAATSVKQDTQTTHLSDIKTNTDNIPSLTSGFFGQAKIAVTGTAVQLGSNTLENGVIITALSTNTGIIKIGGSGVTNVSDGTGNSYLLEAGASISVAVTNTNVLYINGTAGDIISFMSC